MPKLMPPGWVFENALQNNGKFISKSMIADPNINIYNEKSYMYIYIFYIFIYIYIDLFYFPTRTSHSDSPIE